MMKVTADNCLEFEKPIFALEKKLEDLQTISTEQKVDLSNEIKALKKKVDSLIVDTFSNLTAWQRVQLSRHSNRPYAKDYIDAIFPDFMELSGDRTFGDDPAILAGFASMPGGKSGTGPQICIVAHQKGRTTKQKMLRNFGMAKPEGYRKALRVMTLANRFKIPILTLIDTPGAYPGIETEERGQAQAIAESIRFMFSLEVPIVCAVIGEGGSGGALAIGVGDRVLMQEFSTYSVISPEGCASILWSDSRLAEKASQVLKMSAPELLDLGVIDGIIHEPKGGAHRDWEEAASLLKSAIFNAFQELHAFSEPKTKTKSAKPASHAFAQRRIDKFRILGNRAIEQVSGKA